MAYVVAATWIAKEGAADRIKEILELLTPLVRENEPGNLFYQAHVSPSDPNVFFIYEQYADEAAFEAHRQTSYFNEHVVNSAFGYLADRSAAFYRTLDD
jgi:quinol monooxygenase YgiN